MQRKQNVEKQSDKKTTKNNGIHNGEIIAVSVCMVILMLAVVWNIVDYMLHEKEEAINNSFNPRQELLASQNIRGSIYSADGEVLAKTRVLAEIERAHV